jgi:hypothetical protein
MGLYQFLRTVGFEHDDVAGGLLAEPPAARWDEKRERLENRIRKVYECLVRHRRALEKLRRDNPAIHHGSDAATTRVQRHQQAYDHSLQLFARLREKLKRVQEKA